ncbi:hypothetical protein I6A84_33285 [Frankia sp. CNm7]|uniref:Glycerophosphoryl diester phosphodiesterase membrane domain-containing protein n=1 Tax=Frankia nepalensis TaxID=1836974 RepID=A0A937RPX2_9ACTN|nr:hypothetical protein [Frankia nepalensis]MBL7496868.1 hypothetical protein [Frankia nepalensis]MBL7512068.1 hypothetical protein [Frankia nepalensis]MBL7522830.1 hypothetical protein [Frankia nepalensis]MBL7630473.1 hypothetical protein [Frankia nepalensis]
MPLRPLSISETLDGTFAAMRTNPGATLGLTAIPGAVINILSTLIAIAAQDASFVSYALLRLVLAGLTLGLIVLMSGVLAVVVAEASLGRKLGLGAAARRVAPRLPGLLALSVLVTLVVVLGLFTAGVVSVWLGILLCLAAPVYALEGGTVGEALSRSRYLMKGVWWRTLSILALAAVIAGVLVLVVAVPVGLLTLPSESTFTDPSGEPTTAGYVVQALGSLLAITIVTPVISGILAILYVDRRIRREGLDVALTRAATRAAPAAAAASAPVGPARPGTPDIPAPPAGSGGPAEPRGRWF